MPYGSQGGIKRDLFRYRDNRSLVLLCKESVLARPGPDDSNMCSHGSAFSTHFTRIF